MTISLIATRAAQLVDGRSDPTVVVPANVVIDFPAARLEEVEQAWKPGRDLLASDVANTEHAEWDWRIKIDSIRSGQHRLVAIECGGDVQALMAVLSQPRPAQVEPKGRPILYIDYLEAAPWNLKRPTNRPRYLGVGTTMIAVAVKLSFEWSWQGRVGLHSLSQAERFYRVNCGMTDLGHDSGYHELTYFEYTEEQAADWLAKVGLSA